MCADNKLRKGKAVNGPLARSIAKDVKADAGLLVQYAQVEDSERKDKDTAIAMAKVWSGSPTAPTPMLSSSATATVGLASSKRSSVSTAIGAMIKSVPPSPLYDMFMC